jgi:hypothetical protein
MQEIITSKLRGCLQTTAKTLSSHCTSKVYFALTEPTSENTQKQWLIYVGGAPLQQSFIGCLTSVSIDDYQFELVKAATGLTGLMIV